MIRAGALRASPITHDASCFPAILSNDVHSQTQTQKKGEGLLWILEKKRKKEETQADLVLQ